MAKKVMDEIKSKSTEVSKPISLDEIIHEYSQIANELELGEVTEELEERLSITEDNINRKMLGYRYVILNNEAKVNTIYKPEVEKLQGRIKKFERTNTYLKDRVCLAAQLFGDDNKYKSDTINVSAVETVSLDTNDTLVQESLDHIKECIINNNPLDIEVETDIVKIDLSFKDISPDQAASILAILKESDNSDINNIDYFTELNVSLKRKEAKELVQEVEEHNEGLKAQYDEYCKSVSEEEIENIPKPEYRKIEFKGLSLKNSYYPRFS